ncbi:MAG: glycoside hydrolase family 2 protein [Chloroflexi bacterium]|nr:glycoside hydrolase family 2 protein [Chloroflexota bacterium]
MRAIIPFNQDWLFLPEEAAPDDRFEAITLPHTNVVLPHHNFDDAEYQFISTYRKRFALPEPLNGRRVYLDFDGAMIASTVTINEHTFEEYRGGYTPFSFDITDYLNPDGDNLLTVRLDSNERKDIPPFGFVVDYLAFGGIYRDVTLRYVAPCHVQRVFVRPQNVLTGSPNIEVDVWLANQNDTAQQCTVLGAVEDDQNAEAEASVTIDVPAHDTVKVTLSLTGGEFRLWTLDEPALYACLVQLYRPNAQDEPVLLDHVTTRFGLREAEFRPDGGFYLNGERLDLVGLNRHQTYPYIGAAAPARLQRLDADILKHELSLNLARTSHYPQSPHFLDRCDEIGLLVFEEIPGWQHIGDEDWQTLSLRDVRAMIERDWNHPSIILWGVRINESQDNEAFYTATNKLAHELDPTRQTGGVRNFPDSQFLEDVFTFNDFSNTVVEPLYTPYMVTEFNGHMFPTKSYDQEERVMEHALRHARIQDKQLGMPNVAGAIGWCAFDYNTHQEFGSGDRICYHGVMDIFRLPKYAAYAYGSQVNPNQQVVLQAATVWSMGDRSEGGIDPLIVFSNCEELEVFIGDERIGRYQPDRETFPHLPYPPFKISLGPGLLTWGRRMADLRIVGYVADEIAAEQCIAADGLPYELQLAVDAAELDADGADMTRLVFRIVDRYGNRLPYTNQVVSFEIDGPADLIGENPFALIGGQAALFVKAQHQPGRVTVRASTPRLQPASVTLTIR